MFDKAWKLALVVVAIALVVGLTYWLFSGEERRELTPLMADLARDSAEDFATRLPRHRDVNTALLLVAGRGTRDEEEQFNRLLLDHVQRSSKYRIRTWEEITDRFGETFVGAAAQKLGLLPGQAPTSLGKAVAAVELIQKTNLDGGDLDGVLLVDVQQFTEGPRQDGLGAQITLVGKLYSTRSKQVVEEVGPLTHEITSAWDLRYIRYWLSESSLLGRVFLWLLVLLGLPWALIQLVRPIVKRKRNAWNVTLLVSLTVVDVLLGWVLLTALATGGWTVLMLLAVAGLAGYYNYDACDYIERRLL